MDVLEHYEKTTEVAERLDIDVSQVRRYAEQERFNPPAVKFGNTWLIPKGAMPEVKPFGRPPTWSDA